MDRAEQAGQYFLTGSQNLAELKSAGESLAGRVGILHLEGMTLEEMPGEGRGGGWLGRYLAEPENLPRLFRGLRSEAAPSHAHLWRGSLPGLLDLADEAVPDYLRSYVETYIERDVPRRRRYPRIGGIRTVPWPGGRAVRRRKSIRPNSAASWASGRTRSAAGSICWPPRSSGA